MKEHLLFVDDLVEKWPGSVCFEFCGIDVQLFVRVGEERGDWYWISVSVFHLRIAWNRVLINVIFVMLFNFSAYMHLQSLASLYLFPLS